MRHETKLTQGCSQVASSHWSMIVMSRDALIAAQTNLLPSILNPRAFFGIATGQQQAQRELRHTPHRSWLCQGTASQHFGELTAFTTARPLDIFWTSQPVMPSMSGTTMEPPTSHFRLTNIKLHQLTRKDLFLPFVLQCSWRRPTWLKFRRGALPHAESHQGVPWELGPWSWKIP